MKGGSNNDNKMGEPILRLNPKIESRVKSVLIKKAIAILLSVFMLLSIETENKRGRQSYDYRIILTLCILRIFLKKTYSDYEIEIRTNPLIADLLGLRNLPGKSTIHRGMQLLTMKLIRKINFVLIGEHLKRKLNIMLDSSGIRTDKKSSWFCLRIKKVIRKRDCNKLHLAVCSDLHLILNWRITAWKRNDSPFFIKLLKPFKILGRILADKGYLSRKNFQFCMDRGGCAFIPFKKGKKKPSTASPKSHPAWKFAFNLWSKFNEFYMNIYHQRSNIESVFSVIKKRFGDKVLCRTFPMRAREISLRLIAYNLKILICYEYANENNLSLWVRAKK